VAPQKQFTIVGQFDLHDNFAHVLDSAGEPAALSISGTSVMSVAGEGEVRLGRQDAARTGRPEVRRYKGRALENCSGRRKMFDGNVLNALAHSS